MGKALALATYQPEPATVAPDAPASAAPPPPVTACLTINEAAEQLRVSRRQFYNLLRSGRIGPNPIELGQRVRFIAAEFMAWIAAGAPPRSRWKHMKPETF